MKVLIMLEVAIVVSSFAISGEKCKALQLAYVFRQVKMPA
jgi:hypothetical protein